MNRPLHLFRIEGVNLDTFVFDTRDLSTLRGSSLLLLKAIAVVEKAIKVLDPEAETLSMGASSGLFRLKTEDPNKVLSEVQKALGPGTDWKNATFVMDIVKVNDDSGFRVDLESLIAANRWRQMSASTLAVPALNQDKEASACVRDGLRPARKTDGFKAPQGGYLSPSVHHRKVYGRKAKQDFYGEILLRNGAQKLNPDLEFASDFEGIAKNSDRTLNGKLALFYADGNSFGKHQADHCKTPEKQKAFDVYIRERRETFLTGFIRDEVLNNSIDWLGDDQKTIRFETLLWGGDELMFVMPARLGWRFATRFFEKMGDLNLQKARKGLPDGQQMADQPLTHAGALVFCQSHAPIDRIKRLATGQMAEFGKRTTKRGVDSLAVVALESFDHLGSGFEPAMRRRYRDVLPLDEMLFTATIKTPLAQCMTLFADSVQTLRESETFPRSQLRALVNHMLLVGPTKAGVLSAFDKDDPPKYFRNATKAEKDRLRETLAPLFPSSKALWLQLEELWDYARP